MPKRIAIAIELDHPVPWHLDCYQGILHYASGHDWSCVVDPYLVGMTGQTDVSDYDGVVGRITKEASESASASGTPVVNHWQNSPAQELPGVYFDYYKGAKLAGDHLVSCGYRRFAHLGISTHMVNTLDLAGLSDAVTAHGFSSPDTFEFSHDFETSREGVIHMRRVLTSWLKAQTSPVGVLSQNSVTARYLAQICGEMGLKVPDDVGIVVQLGDQVLTLAASPTLTVIDSDYFGLGLESAKYLDQLMSGQAPDAQPRRVIPTGLVVRESSDFYLSSDPLVTEAMRYIADHCRQTLRVEDLADALNTSRRTLERRFEEIVGRSVYSEIARLRAEYVKRQLVETKRPLAKIAQDCGFSSASHFTRFFSNVVGMTPSAYRKAQLSGRGRLVAG
ncbi:MAG: helix-turn-helix domain-containing protein [Phycisphaeraceae bacterium]